VTYAQDAQIMSADRDLIYSSKVGLKVGDTVSLYRTGKTYYDPKTKECLGYMAFKSAEAQILEKQNTEKANNIVLQVKHNLEAVDRTNHILKEDRPPVLSMHYIKPALFRECVNGYIIDVWEPHVKLIGKNSAVLISLGERDGIKIGTELEVYRSKDLLDFKGDSKKIKDERPEIRVGRVLVYQVSEKMSLAVLNQMFEKVIKFDKVRGEIDPGNEDPCADQQINAHPFDDTCHGADCEGGYLLGDPCKEAEDPCCEEKYPCIKAAPLIDPCCLEDYFKK
jgi:hypothetical protein